MKKPTPGDDGGEDAVTEVVDVRSEVERQRMTGISDALQRLQADFENYRKRVARSSMDAADARRRRSQVAKMLPVLDAFDLAAQEHFLSAPSEEAEALDQARAACCWTPSPKRASSASTAVGVEFNPQVHDAVAHVGGRGTAPWSIRCCAPDTDGRVRSYIPAMVKVRG